MKLWLDRETWCELDLTDVGTYRYAEEAHDLLIAYAIDDEPAKVWDCTAEDCPADLWDAMQHADEVIAHNAQFDKAIHNGPKQQHLPRIALERWRCTMAQALSHALPASLSALCDVLKVPEDQSKLAEGKKLVRLFTQPQPANRKLRRATRETHPTEWDRFKAYAINDIVAMRECARRMPTWNWDASAIAEWHCDQRINERGFQVDTALTRSGARAAVEEKDRIARRFRQLTGGVVDRPSQRAQFQAFLNTKFGLQLEDTRSDTFLQHLKNPNLPAECAELMRLSIAANKTSTAKYAALDPAVSADGRFRGGLQFAGAGRTRRFAGRLFQPQNLPSRGLPSAEEVETYIECLKEGVHDLFFEDLMRFGAAALRGVVIPPPGKKLVVADLSNIEGRMLAWVAGEYWKLRAFRDYDAGTGPDLYNVTAVSIIGGDPWKVNKRDRNVFGKVPDLACLAGDTQVLTDSGLKAITEVSKGDRLWDGIEWVRHDGLSDNGVRPVVNVDGIRATPDHLINTLGTWLPAQEHASSESILSQALATGTAAWLSWSAQAPETFSCNATAAPRHTVSCSEISDEEPAPGATDVPRKRLSQPEKCTGGTKAFAPIQNTDAACSTALLHVSTAVATRTTRRTPTTEGAESRCSRSGCKTEDCSSPTYSRCQGGTTPSWNSTDATSIEGTNPETCGSSHGAKTATTNGRCESLPQRSNGCERVYDLLNAGPRNRFLVKSASGWLLVHNSGYQGGVAGYQTFARAYNVRMADYWGVIQSQLDPMCVHKAKENLNTPWGRTSQQSLEISDVEWMASESCKLAWRQRHPATVKFWYALQDAAKNAIRNWGAIFTAGECIKVRCVTHRQQRWLVVRLPSGRFLTYFNPRLTDDGSIVYEGEAAEEGKTTRQWIDVFTHGGKMTGNVCQTLARDILMPALQEAERRDYLPVLSVHDEGICEVPDAPEFDTQGLIDILARNPDWSAGLPLAAAGFECYRYKKD